MDGISDLRICGIDPTRPPRVRKEPYIDLHFVLNHKAPPTWCELFNDLTNAARLPAKITPAVGLHIDTWARTPADIAPLLKKLKERVKTCTDTYIARIEAEAARVAQAGAQNQGEEGEQGRLNAIIKALDFDD